MCCVRRATQVLYKDKTGALGGPKHREAKDISDLLLWEWVGMGEGLFCRFG